jgi:very-short-patch-repair endonuclease
MGVCSRNCAWDFLLRLEEKKRELEKTGGQSTPIIKKYEYLPNETFLQEKSNELRAKMPLSEIWFWKKWSGCGMKQDDDEPNKPFFNKYIPDIQNERLKYVIEVDGKIHCFGDMRKRDSLKDNFYKNHGYKVFRVKADSDESFVKFLTKFKEYYLEKTGKDTKTIKFILRKRKI